MAIKVYSTPTCKWCNVLKEHLDSNNIKYVDVDVSKDTKGALEMIKKSGQRAVPVIDIDGNIIVGYDKEYIDKLLNAS
ncbi:glutaredoxin domain-containing protein [Ruminiclostridium cellobioparum]|jgi:glutaredoxin 3|uniref:glutaredoxin domain-containing protein n=1 Tax=Ruminiclostridium cellobioparum TaxID=29355 RepID=UPI000486C4BF|nr:glutaredoxin domain-containing protein [Ruminiclostridium cellobioparum]